MYAVMSSRPSLRISRTIAASLSADTLPRPIADHFGLQTK